MNPRSFPIAAATFFCAALLPVCLQAAGDPTEGILSRESRAASLRVAAVEDRLSADAIRTCAARGGVIGRNQYGQAVCLNAKESLDAYRQRMAEPPAAAAEPAPEPPPAQASAPPAPEPQPGDASLHEIEAGAPQPGGEPITGVGVHEGAPDTPPPPNPGGAAVGIVALAAGLGLAAVAVGAALAATSTGTGTCYLRSCLKSSISGSCSCQEFQSSELCQFSTTGPGGQCVNQSGFTTALCPSGYSCVNGTCRNDC